MFSKRRFRRRNKPSSQHFLEGAEQQQETPFIPPVQTKLNIGKPGDVYELEADKTADAVVAKTDTADSVQKMGAEEEEVQAKPLATGLTPFVQKQEAAEEEESVQAMAEKEEEAPVQMQKEEEEPVQTKEEEEEVQAKSNRVESTGAQFEQQLKQRQGNGQKLSSKVREPLEAAFGADFTGVNIHIDGKADELNKQINSQAFAHGANIYFKRGKFNPSSKKGQHLLAHELTHTIQQGAVDSKRKTNNNKKPSGIQRVPIDYREITWDDFNGPIPEDKASKFSAEIAKDIVPVIQPDFINAKPKRKDESTATVTITYRPDKIALKGIMDTDLSWKKKWLIDDEAAKAEFGTNVNYTTKREILLSHEQIHFKIVDNIAKIYTEELRAGLPTDSYSEDGPAKSDKEVENFADEVLNRKAEEIYLLIDQMLATARAEDNIIHEIYDDETQNSQKLKKQEKWEDEFETRLQAIRDKIKADAGAQQNAE